MLVPLVITYKATAADTPAGISAGDIIEFVQWANSDSGTNTLGAIIWYNATKETLTSANPNISNLVIAAGGGGGGGGSSFADMLLTDNTATLFIGRDTGTSSPVITYYKISDLSVYTPVGTIQVAGAAPSGFATSANQTNAAQKTQIVDSVGTVITQTGGALDVNLKSGGFATSALQTTGNTALTTINTTLGSPMQNSGGSVTANLGTLNGVATNAGITGVSSKTLTDINTTLGTPLQAGGNVAVTSMPTVVVTNTNLDVALSTRLKPADTLAGVTTLGSITSALPSGNNVIGKFSIDQTTPGTTNLVSIGTNGQVAATQSGTWNVTNISGTISLPTGAATAAKQPALGTAGTPSTDVLTVQGIQGGKSFNVSMLSVSPAGVDSTALEASHVIPGGQAQLLELIITNTKASGQYYQIFNSATLPADGATPNILLYVAATSTFVLTLNPYARNFASGVAVCNSSTPGTKTIGSADSWFSFLKA